MNKNGHDNNKRRKYDFDVFDYRSAKDRLKAFQNKANGDVKKPPPLKPKVRHVHVIHV